MSSITDLEKECSFFDGLMIYLPPNEAQLEEKVQENEDEEDSKKKQERQERNQNFAQKQRNQQKQNPQKRKPPKRPGFEGAKIIKKKREENSNKK